MMKRDQCFRALARHVTDDEIVVTTYSSAVDWLALGERTLNYCSVGAMGLDSSHALGLALGRPDRRIICLQGDGSLLMNLGCLVTIAAARPENLVHFVVQNDTYEANGGHPIPSTGVDFAAIKQALIVLIWCGLRDTVAAAEFPALGLVVGEEGDEARVPVRVFESGQDGDLGDVAQTDDGIAFHGVLPPVSVLTEPNTAVHGFSQVKRRTTSSGSPRWSRRFAAHCGMVTAAPGRR